MFTELVTLRLLTAMCVISIGGTTLLAGYGSAIVTFEKYILAVAAISETE